MYPKYDLKLNRDFNKDWLLHKKCKEWWYATGILFDENKNMYSYQYTLLNIKLGLITLRVPMCAFTDYKNKKHYYIQEPHLTKKGFVINESVASYPKIATAKKLKEGIDISIHHKDFDLALFAQYGKGAFWHCNKGILQMGKPNKKEITYYYSYPSMPTRGTVKLNNQVINLKGDTWFDKQGGTYSLTDLKTHWEWFSLRFFDNEQIMLFTFNDAQYNDGTYINKDNQSMRLNDYQIKRTKTLIFNNLKWSCEWEVNLNVKDKYYKIEPIQLGHINFAYFEQLCYIKDKDNNILGYAFAELLPGIWNINKNSVSIKNLLKRIEY